MRMIGALEPGEDVRACLGVAAHDDPLVVGELAGLGQDGVGHGDLAHVVHRLACAASRPPGGGEAQDEPDALAQQADRSR